MNKKTSVPLLLSHAVLLLLLSTAQTVSAQAAFPEAQEARQALASLPDAQVVWYVNARRITNEALPRIVPPSMLREAFGEVRKNAGFDLTSINYVVAGARFPGGAGGAAPIALPEVVVVVNGDFSADALLSAMKLAGQGMYRTESYGARTLNLFDLNKSKKAESSDAQSSAGQPSATPTAEQSAAQWSMTPPEIAVTALDPNTLLIGVVSYVKEAIDARDGGQGRLRPEFIDFVTRQPDTLVSLAGEIPESASKYLQMAGAPKNDEMMRLAAAIKRVQAALTMDATDFGLHAVVGTDTAENARALNGMLSMGINILRAAIEKDMREHAKAKRTKDLPVDRAALAAANSLRNTAIENEIQLSTSLPQTTVAALVRSQSAKPRAARKARPRGTRRKR